MFSDSETFLWHRPRRVTPEMLYGLGTTLLELRENLRGCQLPSPGPVRATKQSPQPLLPND